MGLYVHLPFCRRKCAYCDFYSLTGSHTEPDAMARYVSALLCHAKAWRDRLFPRAADTLYLGGGTPSLLPPAELVRLVKGMRGLFALPSGAEITLEANPDSLEDRVLYAALESGVNRLSLGVQSFDDRHLSALGRLHTAGQARLAIKRARRAGFDNLSLDLMFGLPGQTARGLSRTLDEALSFSPGHLSCYLLKLEPGTPLYEKKHLLLLPDEQEQTAQYELICERLAKAGYVHYEISNFALEGRQSRHNLKYWQGAEYLGLGAGAHSLVQNRRFFYPQDMDAYQSAALAGQTLPEDAAPRSLRDAAEEHLLTGLRTRDGVGLAHPALTGLPGGAKALMPCAKRLADAGLANLEDGRLTLTERGFWLSNAVIVELFRAAGL